METGLYKKLLQIQAKVNGLGKDSRAGDYGAAYEYVSDSKVLGFVRPLMTELGLLLVQEVTGLTNTRMDYATKKGERSEVLTSISLVFRWIDTDTGESMAVPFAANGQNGWDKGLGSALTYAERYFLLKFFHIPTDEDDVDALKRDSASPIGSIQPRIFEPQEYNKFVAAAAKGTMTKSGLTARESFTRRYNPTPEELKAFDGAVIDFKVNNNIK